jgi:hypothetical protein
MKEPMFQQAYAQARQEALSETLALLQQGMLAAVTTLRALLDDPDVPAPTRVTAARTILEHGLRSLEATSLERRIVALEAALEAAR